MEALKNKQQERKLINVAMSISVCILPSSPLIPKKKTFYSLDSLCAQKDWSIVKSALDEHRISCHLDLVNSSITFSTKRTREPDIARKARDLLKLLAINVPAFLAINVFTQPNHVCEIIVTGPKNGGQNGGLCARDPTITREDFLERVKLLKSSAEDISRLTLCQILIGEFFVLTVGTSGGLRIVRRVVEDCILYRMPPADNIKFIRMQLATKKLEDLRL